MGHFQCWRCGGGSCSCQVGSSPRWLGGAGVNAICSFTSPVLSHSHTVLPLVLGWCAGNSASLVTIFWSISDILWVPWEILVISRTGVYFFWTRVCPLFLTNMTQITPTSVGPVVIHGACFLTSFLTVWGLHGGDVIDGPGHEVCSVHSFHIGLKWGSWPFLKPSANLGFSRIYGAGYGFGHKILCKKRVKDNVAGICP